MQTTKFENITILTGINTHPGSGNINVHQEEINLFKSILVNINRDNPVMIEIGCFWAIWSLLFRDKFKQGKNILIDLGKRPLYIGVKNFELNNFNCTYYHGGFFIDNSSTYSNRASDLEYINNNKDTNVDELIINDNNLSSKFSNMNLVGSELNFNNIYTENNLDIIDLIHMDIQGSELPLINNLLPLLQEKKILNIVIATHSQEIHNSIINTLAQCGYANIININYGGMGGDGYIYSKCDLV